MLLANHGALTIGPDVYAAYYKMETIEHFAKISLVTRQLGRENLLSREEVAPAAGTAGKLRDQVAGADLRGRFRDSRSNADQASCQIVEAPASRGARLIPTDPADLDGEIRLSYRELTALIEDAVKALLGGQHG